jgi:2-polyprenyl-3-methyl-5-hydroxy-6-metoxy-1,4-benzoquinol methylase
MHPSEKRNEQTNTQDLRRSNRSWWQDNPMTYDWRRAPQAPEFSAEWFEVVDAKQLVAYPHLMWEGMPFGRLMPRKDLADRRVLEIGCGMGLHTQWLAEAGARVTAIDITDRAVTATRKRLALRGLSADVMEMDAEKLQFNDDSFDLVWSWGVIHHSASTSSIIREISRVLVPSGECRIMVYNRDGTPAMMSLLSSFLRLEPLRSTSDEILWRHTDGFHARYYTRDQFEDLFRPFFSEVTCVVTGQATDAVPLPRLLRRAVERFVPEKTRTAILAKRGGFLFAVARSPRD